MRSLIITLIALALLTGCSRPEPTIPPSPSPIATETEVEGVTALPTPEPDPLNKVFFRADREVYLAGETVILTVDNLSDGPIAVVLACAINPCQFHGGEFFCEERECDGPETEIPAGGQIVLLEEIALLVRDGPSGVLFYKMFYREIASDMYTTLYSREFVVQDSGPTCVGARAAALLAVSDSPLSAQIDTSRVIIRRDAEKETCAADFALSSAGEIEPGRWSEGVIFLIDARTGQIIDETAYER